ncbi:MAG TPA: S41 family peptidase [Candidatus Eisenbacteria bacterium]|nr:S41 family peptidase [Candidatus Eisenbacteria bacterium]
MIRRHFALAGLLAALFAVGWWVGRSSATGPSDLYANVDGFIEVLQKVEQSYVDTVEPEVLVDGAIKGMLHDLDPYSQYLDESSWDNLKATTHGSFGGIGIVVSVRDNYPTVISPIEGSPAWTLGLRPGDVIVKIDGASSAGLTVDEVATRLRGPAGTSVKIAVRREGEEDAQEYTIQRQVIVTKSVPYSFMAEDHTGYLRLANFSENSGAEMRTAMERLRLQGATRLVLDLRANPGGLLDQAVDVVEQLVKPNTLVVFTRGRAKGQDNRYYSSERRPQLDWPMVVLVDQGSASASEIVAGALQDLDRALVVGQTTFGKGSVQSVFPLRGKNAALKLTTAKYYTPSGRSIHKAQASRPSLEVENDEEDALEPQPSPADTAPRRAYQTASGRKVLGGGGIVPDVVVVADSLPPLTRRVESRSLSFRFANRWTNQHPGAKLAAPNEAQWKAFLAFLEAEKVPATPAEIQAERPVLERSIHRELARRLSGDPAAAKVALEGDPVFEQALDILTRARTAREVFRVAASSGSGSTTR